MIKSDNRLEGGVFPQRCLTVLVPLAFSALLVAGSGCEIHAAGALEVQLIVRDAETSRLVDDFLLLRCKQELKLDTGPFETDFPTKKFVEASVSRMDSGGVVELPMMMDVGVYLLLSTYAEGEDYRYIVLKEGYVPTAVCAAELMWADASEVPRIVDLPRGKLKPLSQGHAWHNANGILKDVIALVPSDDPLKRRLVAMAEQ